MTAGDYSRSKAGPGTGRAVPKAEPDALARKARELELLPLTACTNPYIRLVSVCLGTQRTGAFRYRGPIKDRRQAAAPRQKNGGRIPARADGDETPDPPRG